jgi:hypothetical protein
MTHDDQLPELPEQIRERLGNTILFEKIVLPTGRPALRLFATSDVRLSSQEWQQFRQLIERHAWHGSRQLDDLTAHGCGHKEYIIIAPMDPVTLDHGFHATRRVNLDAILADGLLPSVPGRQTCDEKYDCEGNIYVCDKLGSLADAGVANSFSAHWWRDHLAKTNRFNDTDWCIVGIDLAKVPAAILYADLRSTKAVIVGDVERVPPAAITLAYPNP